MHRTNKRVLDFDRARSIWLSIILTPKKSQICMQDGKILSIIAFLSAQTTRNNLLASALHANNTLPAAAASGEEYSLAFRWVVNVAAKLGKRIFSLKTVRH